MAKGRPVGGIFSAFAQQELSSIAGVKRNSSPILIIKKARTEKILCLFYAFNFSGGAARRENKKKIGTEVFFSWSSEFMSTRPFRRYYSLIFSIEL